MVRTKPTCFRWSYCDQGRGGVQCWDRMESSDFLERRMESFFWKRMSQLCFFWFILRFFVLRWQIMTRSVIPRSLFGNFSLHAKLVSPKLGSSMSLKANEKCLLCLLPRWGAKPWFRRAVNWATMGGEHWWASGMSRAAFECPSGNHSRGRLSFPRWCSLINAIFVWNFGGRQRRRRGGSLQCFFGCSACLHSVKRVCFSYGRVWTSQLCFSSLLGSSSSSKGLSELAKTEELLLLPHEPRQ